jgi:hypothetical protein
MTLSARKAGSKGYEEYRAALISRNTSLLSGFSFISTTGGHHLGGEPVLVDLLASGVGFWVENDGDEDSF